MKYTNRRYQQTMGPPEAFLYCQSQMENDPGKRQWQRRSMMTTSETEYYIHYMVRYFHSSLPYSIFFLLQSASFHRPPFSCFNASVYFHPPPSSRFIVSASFLLPRSIRLLPRVSLSLPRSIRLLPRSSLLLPPSICLVLSAFFLASHCF
jgi:hypothetical protein